MYINFVFTLLHLYGHCIYIPYHSSEGRKQKKSGGIQAGKMSGQGPMAPAALSSTY